MYVHRCSVSAASRGHLWPADLSRVPCANSQNAATRIGSLAATSKVARRTSSIGSCHVAVPRIGRLGLTALRVEEIAKKRGISMAQVAVAWVLSKEGVTAPIVGTTNLDNLKDIIGTLSILRIHQLSRMSGLMWLLQAP